MLDRCQFVRLGTEKVPMSPQLKAEINKQCKFYGTGKLSSTIISYIVWEHGNADARTEGRINDHPRSGVCNSFSRVCLSVCQTITFESLDVGSSFSHILYISREYGSIRCFVSLSTRSLAIAKRPCDCCIILKSGSYAKVM